MSPLLWSLPSLLALPHLCPPTVHFHLIYQGLCLSSPPDCELFRTKISFDGFLHPQDKVNKVKVKKKLNLFFLREKLTGLNSNLTWCHISSHPYWPQQHSFHTVFFLRAFPVGCMLCSASWEVLFQFHFQFTDFLSVYYRLCLVQDTRNTVVN